MPTRFRWEPWIRAAYENAPEPLFKEVMACEQLIAYVAKFDPRAPEKEDKPAAAPAAPAADTPDTMEGGKKGQMFQVLKKDVGVEDDPMVAMFGGLEGKKKKKGKGPKPEPTVEEKLKAKMGSHSMDILASFALVKVTPPITVGDAVTSTLDALKARLESFKAKQVKEVEKRKKLIEAGGEMPAPGSVTAILAVEGDSVEVKLTVQM